MKLYELNEINEGDFPSKFPITYRKLKLIEKSKKNSDEIKIDFDATRVLVSEINKINDVYKESDKKDDFMPKLNQLMFEYINAWLMEMKFYNSSLPQMESFYEDKEIDKFFKEFLKLFFVLEYQFSDDIYSLRFQHFENNHEYIKQNYKTEEMGSLIKKLSWFHDGWWNNYYIEIPDTFALDILEYIEKERKEELHEAFEKDFFTYSKFYLMKMYRLWEHHRSSEAISAAREALKYYEKTFKKRINKEKLATVSWREHRRNAKNFSYYQHMQYKTNFLMFLYRTLGEKKILKKLLKTIDHRKAIKNIEKCNKFSDVQLTVISPFRPQQLIKNIEILIDDYMSEPSDDKRVNIRHFIMRALGIVSSGYYGAVEGGIVNYFILYEIMFVIFYYYESVEKMDLTEVLK